MEGTQEGKEGPQASVGLLSHEEQGSLPVIVNRPAWQRDALCLEYPGIDWFDVRRSEAARVVCQRCAVQAECLAFAIEHKEIGLWGGTDDQERRALPLDVPRHVPRLASDGEHCANCGIDRPKLVAGRCKTCWQYRWRNGRERGSAA